ncbi:MAG: L-2-hydroxyglutarate oxidase, partial [Bacteroidia bacterium]|nr:L-2-hydroxyglutarate oxidase [Bacteroidia bacterium]
YRKTDFSWSDTWSALLFSGTRRFLLKHWKKGLQEYRRAFSKKLFWESARRLAPSLTIDELLPARSGVRALALSAQGELVDDFAFLNEERMLHVINAPSPAATACLAIGRQIAQMVLSM